MIHTILDLSEVLYPMEIHKNIYNNSNIHQDKNFLKNNNYLFKSININFSTDPNSFIK